MMGARVFEKHFTLDHSWKGTDHSFSLMPEGLRKMVRNLNRIPKMLGNGIKKNYLSEKKPIKKMAKSIVVSKDLKSGHKLKFEDLSFKSPGGWFSSIFILKINKKNSEKRFIKRHQDYSQRRKIIFNIFMNFLGENLKKSFPIKTFFFKLKEEIYYYFAFLLFIVYPSLICKISKKNFTITKKFRWKKENNPEDEWFYYRKFKKSIIR